VVDEPDESSAYMAAMRRGFDFADELNSECGPVHFLVGIAKGDGPLRAALVGRPRRAGRCRAPAGSRCSIKPIRAWSK
jgi:hypothetical protein